MRIAVCVREFPKGSETFIVNKVAGLVRLGHDVRVVCSRSDRREWKKFDALRAAPALTRRVERLWPHEPKWLAALLIPAAVATTLLRNPSATMRYLMRGCRSAERGLLQKLYSDAPLIAFRPDVVHFEFGALAVGKTYARRLLDCKLVVSFRGYDLNYIGLESPDYYGEVWKSADAIHVLGEDLEKRAYRRGCPRGKAIVRIPPAIDATLFQMPKPRRPVYAGSRERPLRILSVGRLEWKKGFEYALQAVAELRRWGVATEYRIVGDGASRQALLFAVQDLELQDCVTLAGPAAQAEVRRQMEWADVFLHTAVSEGFCNAVLEAQAMELPVVCSDADGLAENVADGATGFVVPRRDSGKTALRLKMLADDPDLRIRMGSSGRQRVLMRFQLQDQIVAFDRLYRMTATRPNGTSGAQPAGCPATNSEHLNEVN